jgi:hypothetical protein
MSTTPAERNHIDSVYLARNQLKQIDMADRIWFSVQSKLNKGDMAPEMIRIAFSAILKIDLDGLFALVMSERKPGFYGPFGGVYKYKSTAESVFERMGFAPEEIFGKEDLNGHLPLVKLREFIEWFCSGKDRESITECAKRELGEELSKSGLNLDSTKTIENLELKPVRRVWEGPSTLSEYTYPVFRIFDVASLDKKNNETEQFINDLYVQIDERNTDKTLDFPIILATRKEIFSHATKCNKKIGAHSGYLLDRDSASNF